MILNNFVRSSLGAITLVGLLATAVRAEWVSYAYSVNADFGFTTYYYPTRAEAEQAALAGCRNEPKTTIGTTTTQVAQSDCQILLSSAQWLAVAETPNQIYWQEAPTRKLAEEAVLKFCKRREPSQTCQLRLSASGSEGVTFSAYRK